MKRWKIAGICLAVAVAAAASGCGKKTGTETTAAESTAAETEEYVAESSVKLGEYKGIAVTVTEASVTDEEVENQIQQVLNSKAEYREVDRAAQMGDQVNIDYKGLLDGEAFKGGTAEGYDLTLASCYGCICGSMDRASCNRALGSGSFIDGFEDGLVGAVKGDQKDLNLTFPDSYPNNPDLAGKEVVFEVTVNAVKERSVPELTDEFVASVSPDDGTVEKYRESTRENLLEQKQLSIDNQRDTDILNAVVDNSEVVCSTASIDEAYDTQLKAYTNMLSSYGVDLATYAGMIGSDEDSFKQEIRQEAKEMAKQSLVLNEIAKQENITIDDSDKEALAKRYGYESLKTMLQNDNIDQKMVDDTALMQKTLDFLVENAKITVSTEENNAALNTEAAEDEAE